MRRNQGNANHSIKEVLVYVSMSELTLMIVEVVRQVILKENLSVKLELALVKIEHL